MGKGASRRAHRANLKGFALAIVVTADFIIGRAFGRPVGFAHLTMRSDANK
jgi:hypothetical protein